MIRKIFSTAALLAGMTAPMHGQTTSAVLPAGIMGSFPALTFGGSGIPNNYVMSNGVANQTALGGTHLFLTATARFADPVVTNNGLGTYYATAGTDLNAPSPIDPYGMWNFDFAITGLNVTAWTYKLYYDFNPAIGNFGDYGYVAVTPTQDSWNLGMNFLASAVPGVVSPPSFATFNPNAAGEYGFALVAYNGATEVGRTAILVNTTATDVVPEPVTLTLLATGLVGLATAGRRKRSARR